MDIVSLDECKKMAISDDNVKDVPKNLTKTKPKIVRIKIRNGFE